MDERIDLLESIVVECGALMRAAERTDLSAPTPCSEYDLRALLEHVAVWVQVFDAAVNDRSVGFDPNEERIGSGWSDTYDRAARAIVEGLRDRGIDRTMTLTSTPLPGEFVLKMMISEYVGHGWDLASAIGVRQPFTDAQIEGALAAIRSILEPQHRGVMFGDEVAVPDGAPLIDRFVGFIGRDPSATHS